MMVGGAEQRLSRREALRLALVGLGAAGASSVLGGCASDSAARGDPERSHRARPNFLLIVADDMRYDQLQYMSQVRRLIQDEGTSFTQGRCNVPLCQPSRVGFLTGQMSKHNDELDVGFAGSRLTDHDNCIGRWMHDANYRCGFFGKYVNWYDGTGGIDPPAGYEAWHELITPSMDYGFRVRLDSGVATITHTYSTDYLSQQTIEFSQGTEPFLCIVTPTQPHSPYVPRHDLADRWSDLRWPVVDEVDASDKPPWIQKLAPLTDADIERIVADARGAPGAVGRRRHGQPDRQRHGLGRLGQHRRHLHERQRHPPRRAPAARLGNQVGAVRGGPPCPAAGSGTGL
jgi:arylsulfatase A-like enzyme